MAINSSSPAPAPSPATTLSAVLGEDRRRERSHHGPGLGQGRLLPLLIPACGRPVGAVGRSSPSSSPHSQIMSKLHRWGTAFLPKSGAAVARDLEARRRTPSPPPRPRASSAAAPAAAQALPRHEAPVMTVSVPERRPLREREEPAVGEPAAGSKANAEADTSTGESAGSSERATSITPVGRGGGGTWLKASPKKTMRYLSLQTDISEEGKSPQSLAELPALVVATDDKFVWADKYRPNVLNEFICNKAVAAELYQLVVAHQCKHFIFEGPPAVGKRSMVLALIRDGFGPDDLKIEEQTKRFELKGEIRKHIDVRVKISGHHVEVNLADLHGYEKYVITTLLNESIPSPNSVCDHTKCRVIVLHDADKLSSDLQRYIGWFLGRYSGCDKIIFCCSDASNLDAVKHLCKVVTLQPPSFDEIIKVLEYIATHESIYLPHDLARRITVSASNNLRQAIRSFEATWKANYPFIEGQAILTGWEEEISNLARNIMEEPSSKQLFVIRGKIRKLIEHDVSPHFIFSHLVAELKRDKDEEFQHSIDEMALDLNHCKECKLLKGQCKGCKSREAALEMRNMNIEGFTEEARDHGETIQCFIMIEEFTVRFMSFYRSLVAKNSNRSGAQ
ncbi:replication factor C subunit 5-like [Phragmites australis]|uniref:replication factor C subunit 5-like n=1 Tax=Phragmites australis TaxID=29695 RepID=UPI002D776486|nr:replication factor C subunit 5-like [Phragmites australis]